MQLKQLLIQSDVPSQQNYSIGDLTETGHLSLERDNTNMSTSQNTYTLPPPPTHTQYQLVTALEVSGSVGRA